MQQGRDASAGSAFSAQPGLRSLAPDMGPRHGWSTTWVFIYCDQIFPCSELMMCRSLKLFSYLFKEFLMWTIFKVLIEFVTTLLLFYVLVFWPRGMWDLSSPTRD